MEPLAELLGIGNGEPDSAARSAESDMLLDAISGAGGGGFGGHDALRVSRFGLGQRSVVGRLAKRTYATVWLRVKRAAAAGWRGKVSD